MSKRITIDRVRVNVFEIRLGGGGLDLIAAGSEGNEDGKTGPFYRTLTLTAQQRNQLIAVLEGPTGAAVAEALGTDPATHEIVRSGATFTEVAK